MMKLLAIPALVLSLALAGCGDTSTATDSPADAAIFTASNTAIAKVDGMTCSSCAGTVCSAIKEIDSVEAVTANPETGEVKIAIKEGTTLDLDAVRQAVTAADYKLETLKLPEAAADGN